MQKKGQSTQGSMNIVKAYGLMVLIVCGVFIIPYYLYLKRSYMSPTARRINDFGNFASSAMKAGPVVMFSAFLAGWAALMFLGIANAELLYSFAAVMPILLIIVPCIWAIEIACKWLAVVHLGVIVDAGKDRVVFRVDQESYDLIDYVALRFIRDLPRLDEIQLSGIHRITRKSGLHAYLLGDFGSRRISFSNKQKRDECIYAITSSGKTNAKVFNEFELT